ncbi:hypothetical protein [Blastococcus sp. CCUG 61487]|uniref:hypothetical protein n=1 Tax=Blastococcus sp. CCUG 61487 TaxID=1840703 RepID=UPI0010C04C1C|nr:hypothetical protein [Blastococcus sp. CCUG 61487]TKJ35147.1 hypothetical protein A6V29_14345 [Blastococcus sp. CCUG 61487]
MTHSIDAPLPPPTATAGSTGQSSSSTHDSPTTKDIATDEAKAVGQTAADAGSQVASTAADQAKQVAHETQRQAQDLLQQGQAQLKDQALAQQHKAAQGLSSLAGELRSLADGTSDGAPGPARDLLQQASGFIDGFADKLQNREPAQLLDEVRSFARRKPGMFLLGAAAAGIVAGRLTSGVRAAHSDSGSGTSGSGGYPSTNYVDPAPTYSDTGTTYTGTGAAYSTAGSAPLPPPPYGTVPPEGTAVPPTAPAGWDDPARRPGGVS